MSIEIKCDRCGKPIEPEGAGVYSSRVASTNLIVNKDGRGEMHDLCDECLKALDIFMSGGLPKPKINDELVYLELPNPDIYACEKELLAGLKRVPEIHISGDLEPLSKLIEGHGHAYLSLSSVKQVIIGVHLR